MSTDHPTIPSRWSTWSWARPGLYAYVIVRLLTWVYVVINDAVTHQGFLAHLSIWDGQWFLQAARHGWPRALPLLHGHVEQNPIAFFPFFPLLMRALSLNNLISTAAVGVALSLLSGATALLSIGKLSLEVQGPDVARRTALLVALAPGAFTFSLIYSEGVLLTLGACGLLALVRRQWWLAGLVAALASFTSPLGLCLGAAAAASAVVAWRRRREYQALISVVLAPLGFVAYMVYLRIHTGTLTAWRRTERDGWKSYPSLKYPLHILWKFLSNPASPTLTGHLLFVGTVVTIVLVVIMVRAHLPAPVLWFGVSSVALSAVSAPIGLRPRFIMCAFPLVMGLAQRYDGPRFRIIAVTSAVLLALMTLEELSSFAVFP